MSPADHASSRKKPSLRVMIFLVFGMFAATVLVLVSVVRSFGIPFTGLRGEYQSMLMEAVDDLEAVANMKKERLESWLRERHADIAALGDNESLRRDLPLLLEQARIGGRGGQPGDSIAASIRHSPEYRRLQLLVDGAIRNYESIDALYIVDAASGVILVSSEADSAGRFLAGRADFGEVVSSRAYKGIWVESSFGGSGDNHVEFFRIIPREKEEGGIEPMAVLVLQVGIDEFLVPMIHAGQGLGKTGEILIVDENRRILVPLRHRLPGGRRARVKDYRIDSVCGSLAARGKEGFLFAKDYRGVAVLAAYRHIRLDAETGWGIVVKSDRSEILGPLWRRLAMSAQVGLGGIVLMFAGLAVLARRLSAPLASLEWSAARVRAGDFAARAELSGSREMHKLADTFNAMAERLQNWNEEKEMEIAEKTRLLAEELDTRKRTETSLRLTQAIGKVGGWQYLIPEGRIIWSDETYHVYGLEPGMGPTSYENLVTLVHPDDREYHERMFEQMLGEGQARFEHRIFLPDGAVNWVCGEGRVERDRRGKPVRIVGAVQNITDRKNMELALAESESRLRSLIESSSDHLFMLSLEGTFVASNDRVSHFGLSNGQELLGKRLEDVYRPEVLEIYRAKLEEVLLQDRSVTFEYVLRDPAGGKCHRLITLYPIRRDGQVDAVGGICKDITEVKKIQEQLLQAQKMEAVGRLAGGVAHDFNNMLSMILGHTELALMKLNSQDPIYAELQQIQDAGRRSAELTRQLLAFSRKQLIAPRAIDLNAQIMSMERMLRRIIGEDIELALELSPELWPVWMDPSQMDQIVANLAVNSKDAMPEGGRLTAETANITCDDTCCRGHEGFIPGDYVMMVVSDAGCGMDKATLEHAFEPFFTTKGEIGGTGLGLSMVYGIVKQNKGFISIYSELGQGTTIKIYLPRYLGDERVAAVAPPEAAAAGGSETILLVEDDDQVRRLVKTVLESRGYTVLDATGPVGAIAACEKHEGDVHLLLTDVVMPVMNGKELESRIKVMKPGIKTLFMSGYTSNAIARRGVLERGVHFLQKPFSMDSLAEKVRNALDHQA